MARHFIVQDVAEETAIHALQLVKALPIHYRSYADQLVRATGSVALNLAEGFARQGKDKRYLYSVAYGSARESIAAIRILSKAGAVGPADSTALIARLDEVCAMTWRLMHPRSPKPRPSLEAKGQ